MIRTLLTAAQTHQSETSADWASHISSTTTTRFAAPNTFSVGLFATSPGAHVATTYRPSVNGSHGVPTW